MKPILRRIELYENKHTVITISLFGIPVYKKEVTDKEHSERKPCGFNAMLPIAPETLDEEE